MNNAASTPISVSIESKTTSMTYTENVLLRNLIKTVKMQLDGPHLTDN